MCDSSKRRASVLSASCLLLALLVGCAHAGKPRDANKGRWRKPPASPPPPGSKLFHQGEDALSWDSDELSRIQSLHLRDFSSVEDYLNNTSLADYLGLHPIDALHMSMPLNLVFIGFQGDGNAKVDVTTEELTSWFAHIDHVLPHTRVALSELSCSLDGHCAGTAEVSLPPSPLPSFVHLNVSCNVAVISKGEVLATFERAINAFSRPTDPDVEEGDQQVDALKLEAFVDSFVSGLGLHTGYTMLVLNPKWSPSLPSYAYRVGFSEYELKLLQQQGQLPELQAGHTGASWGVEPQPPMFGGWQSSGWPISIKKFKVSDLQVQSSGWARAAAQYLTELEDFERRVLKYLGPRTKGSAALARAATLLQRGAPHSDLAALVAASIRLPPEHIHNPRFRATHPLEDCPTPLWVSQNRWMLVDLTARRTDWGPALGGEGVVVHTTLPDVGYAFGAAEEKRAEKRLVKSEKPEESQLRDKLSTMRSERLSQVATQQQQARSMLAHASDHVVHGGAPGEVPPGQIGRVDPDGKPLGSHGGLSDEQQMELDKEHQEATLRAELNVYEEFATIHCAGRIDPPAVCAEAEEAVMDLKHSLQLLAKSTGHNMKLNPEHHWDIFGIETDDTESSAAYSAAKDVFFSELSNILSRGLRHVIAPPSATWHHRGYLHDTASPYARKVHFSIYTIQDTSRVLGPWREKGVHFDIEAFKQQITRLAMPHQQFSYSVVSINLLDDPALAAAFSVSLSTSFMQVPHAVLDPVENEALYLDSRELALRLKQRFRMDESSRRTVSADPHAMLEVPIFIFELDRDIPVLIDEHYNARALEDMVLVVQNAANQDEHPTGMMCDGILLHRPLSPLKHALSAVLQHLGGILPPHLGYNPHRKVMQHDWLWSVGAHPLSWTSWGGSFSQIHIDALHRSYLLDAIDSSVDLVNDGIVLLQEQAPHAKTFKKLTSIKGDLQQLLHIYMQLINTWRTMVGHAAVLEYHTAAEVISNSESIAKTFYQKCQQIIADSTPQHCAARSPGLPPLLIAAIYGTSASAGLAVAVVLIYPLFKRKSKAM